MKKLRIRDVLDGLKLMREVFKAKNKLPIDFVPIVDRAGKEMGRVEAG